jgi:hypothetical protein
MGCDIHVHVEVKINNLWHHYSVSNLESNCRLFARMADVKNLESIEPISLPKGLPSDVTFLTQLDATWKNDKHLHSHSWLSSQEVKELEDWCYVENGQGWYELSQELGFLFGNLFSGFFKYPEEYPPGLQDFRLVFWFDN